jgi:hypothetical protein
MSERPISPLRQRMLEDMAVRKFGDKTRHDYIRHVEAFASFLGRSPDTATADDVRRYQVHLTESGGSRRPSTARPRRCASSSPPRSTAPSSPATWPACTTRGSCRACSRLRRWAVFWKRHPAPASSTRRP